LRLSWGYCNLTLAIPQTLREDKVENNSIDLPITPEMPTDEAGPYGYFGFTLYQLFAEGERITSGAVQLWHAKQMAVTTAEPTRSFDVSLKDLDDRAAAMRLAIPRKAAAWFHKIAEYSAPAAATKARIDELRETYLSGHESWFGTCV